MEKKKYNALEINFNIRDSRLNTWVESVVYKVFSTLWYAWPYDVYGPLSKATSILSV